MPVLCGAGAGFGVVAYVVGGDGDVTVTVA